MPDSPRPTAEVLRARRYAARSRVMVALLGWVLLLVDRSVDPHPLTAALGLGVILLTGIVEATTYRRALLRVEEPFSCLAGVLIIGFGGGHVTPITLLWLVAAAVGVLARGGRVGALGRLLVLGTLASPLVTRGAMSAENVGLALGAVLLLLSTGRLSRETAELLRRARYDADHDRLTGALSSVAYRAALDAAAARARPEAPLHVLLIDIDDLSRVNKRQGHAAGDAALLSAVEAIAARIPPGGALGRIDGDTFALSAPLVDPLELADAIRAAIDGVTVSVGTARAPEHGSEAEALIGAADVALRVAKRSGKARAVAYDGEPLGAAGQEGARAALRRLLAGNGLHMAAQPIVDVESGEIHAYEALARFETDRGHGPLHWFALAEELGLRPELELACLRAGLALLDHLPPAVLLTVNLSAPMLCDPRAADLFAACPTLDRLIVEVTEEALARDDGSMAAAIAALRARGARFAVDDIGAGYSGLGQVATLRPAYLKLDRGLVRGLDTDRGRASLTAAMVGYARATGALLVAEGVETESELRVLREIGVPLIQGFLLARPGPPWPPAQSPPAEAGHGAERLRAA